MLFWITVLALTIAAVILAFLPALTFHNVENQEEDIADFDHDIAVYRDQLAELDAESQRGAIATSEASQARAEIARRLFAAEEKRKISTKTRGRTHANGFSKFVAIAGALIFVPGLSFLIYTSLGSPTLESQPLAPRLEAQREIQRTQAEDKAQMGVLVAKAEAHLVTNPNDGRGWDVLAPIYFRLGELEKSEQAYREAIRLLGNSPSRLSGLGEIAVMTGDGRVNDTAKDFFRQALAMDSADGRSLYYSAISKAQSGDIKQAFADLQTIALNENIDGIWRAAAASGMQQINERGDNEQVATPANDGVRPPALDQDTLDTASDMSDQDRQAMIASMVDGLDKRLADQGGTPEEWQRLIRAHIVLNQREQAQNAAKRAVSALKATPDDAETVRRFAKELGLDLQGMDTQ